MAVKQDMLERSVIASVIAGDVLPSQLELTPNHFMNPLCARLMRLMMQMEAARKEISLPDVCMEDESLDAQEVVSLSMESCVSTVLVEQHCRYIREQAQRRALAAILEQGREQIHGGAGVAEVIAGIRLKLDELLATQGGGTTMMELIMKILEETGQEKPKEQLPVGTGIGPIDECLCGGFRPGDLAVVAALTSVGKSAMLSFMMRNAAGQGKKILLVSCEMSDEQNAERYLAAISGVMLDKIICRKPLTDEENISISDGLVLYHPENIRVISGGAHTVQSVRREALRMRMTDGLDMIVVDYLQRLRPDIRSASKAEEVGAIASGLKSMAVDLAVPVLTAAQFNREAARARREAQGNENIGVPALHQLRDSSQIEDEANTVITLDEPQRAPEGHVRRINAHIVKNRSGALRAMHLLFDPRRMVYAVAPREEA